MNNILSEENKEEQERAMKKEIKLLLNNLLQIKMKNSSIVNSFHNNVCQAKSRKNSQISKK